MLLKNHVQHTVEALENLDINKNVKSEIIVGSTVNDLCEFTNEGQTFLNSKQVVHSIFGIKEKVFGASAIYQSHFGNLASIHSMSKTDNESPETTMKEIEAWFNFLNDLAIGSISINAEAKIAKDKVPISYMFAGNSIEYDQIFDSDDEFQIRNRAIGMMCHLIQDLFTYSHCERNDHNEILKFYYYQLQDKDKHKKEDHVLDSFNSELLKQCKSCIQSITLENKAYDYCQVLSLSADAHYSDGGIFS